MTVHALEVGVEIYKREIAMRRTYAYIHGALRDPSNEVAAH